MAGAGDQTAAPGLHFAMDSLAMNVHGNADSHIDALCHVIYDGTLYNGVHPGTVTARDGTALSIDVARDGIAGRGMLLDIPRARGVSWLLSETGTPRRVKAAYLSDADIKHLASYAAQLRRHETGA